MQRTALVLLAAASFACTQPAPRVDDAAAVNELPKPAAGEPLEPARPQPKQTTSRKDLIAEDLPPVPTLPPIELSTLASGRFDWPAGTDELVPRAAVELGDGLLLAGQAYHERKIGRPSPSWAWLGVVPTSGPNPDAASSTKLEPGAVRAAISDGQGGALLAGIHGAIQDARGWFAVVDAHGALGLQVTLDSPTTTELFDLIPGRGDGEFAVVVGYVDAQGWLVSLDGGGGPRWQTFIGSYGYTQPRALTRTQSGLLMVGTRSQKFGESWWARAPIDGGDPSGADVTQDKLAIEGADEHQMLRAIVSLGDAGSIAIGTAKRNFVQAHDQLIAVGFDAGGSVTWSKVVDGIRVTDVFGGRATDDGNGLSITSAPRPEPGALPRGLFIVSVPGPSEDAGDELALVQLGVDGSAKLERIAESRAWSSAGWIEGASTPTLLGYSATDAGMQWRRWAP